MWAWHFRTWIANGAVHNNYRIGLGWGIVALATVVVFFIGARIVDR